MKTAKEKLIHYINICNFVEFLVNFEGYEDPVQLSFIKNDEGKYMVQSYRAVQLSDGHFYKSNEMYAEDELDKWPEDILETLVDKFEDTLYDESKQQEKRLKEEHLKDEFKPVWDDKAGIIG